MSAILRASSSPPHFWMSGMMMSDRPLLEQFAEAVAQEQVLAAADGRVRRLAHVAHRVDVLGRDRLLEPQQLEGLQLPGHPLARPGVVASVHVDGELDALGQRLAHERDLVHHVIDLGVVRRPVHPVEARGVAGIVDVDLGRGEAQVDDLGDELASPWDRRGCWCPSRNRRGRGRASGRRAAGRPAAPGPCPPGPRARSRPR